MIDQYLLFKIRYYVVPNCGTANEINGALYHDMVLSMEMRLKRKLTSNFIFFHWSAPNPSEKMMIMYLPTIWVFTWYDSMSRDCHMTFFLLKAVSFVNLDMFQILQRSYPGFSSYVATEKSCTFKLCLKKTFGCVELQKIDNISADVSSITVYMETRLE